MRMRVAAPLCGVLLCAQAALPAGPVEFELGFYTDWSVSGIENLMESGSKAGYPYGDRLAYSGAGLNDVNGDGKSDIALSFYERPFDDGTTRIERAGFVAVYSGADFAQIGDIVQWGSIAETILAHDLGHMHDIDGDGRHELLIVTNKPSAGGAWIWAYTARYNVGSTDETERWVPLVEVDGSIGSHEFALNVIDHSVDVNGDLQDDLIVTSRFYRASGTRSNNIGAAWVFMMPLEEVFDQIAADAHSAADADGDGVTDDLPLVYDSADEYNIRIVGTTIGHDFARQAARVGSPHFNQTYDADLDRDGAGDFVVSAPYAPHPDDTDPNPNKVGVVYLYLSKSKIDRGSNVEVTDGGQTYWSFKELSPLYYLDAGVVTKMGSTAFADERIDLEADDADYALVGNDPLPSPSPRGGLGWRMSGGHDFDGDGDKRDFMVLNPEYDNNPSGGDPRDGRISVYYLGERFDDAGWTYPTSMRVWGVDETSDDEDGIKQDPDFNIDRDAAISSGFNGADHARDFDGDGDFEIVAIADGGTKPAILVYDIDRVAGVTTSSLLDIIRPQSELVPADPDYTMPGESPGGGAAPNYGVAINTTAGNINFWPAWDLDDDGRDDYLIGAVAFPKDIEDPDWPSHPDYNGEEHVAGGKAYILLNKKATLSNPSPSSGVAGTNVAVTINGDHLVPPWGQDNFELDDFTVKMLLSDVTLENPIVISGASAIADDFKSITGLTFEIDPDAAAGARTVKVNTRYGLITVGATFTTTNPSVRAGDLDNDGLIGPLDLTTIIANWGDTSAAPTKGDVNGDGVIDARDLELMLRHWSAPN